MRCWRGYLSAVRYKCFAYHPADATATPSSLASLKSRFIKPFWCRLTQVIMQKAAVKAGVPVCVAVVQWKCCKRVVDRTVSHARCVSFSSLTGLITVCRAAGRRSLSSSVRFIKPRSSSDRTDRSPFTAGTLRERLGSLTCIHWFISNITAQRIQCDVVHKTAYKLLN